MTKAVLPLWHCLLSVSILGAIVFLLLQSLFLSPLEEISAIREERENSQMLVERYAAIASMREALEAQKLVVIEQAKQQQNYLQGATEALAAAGLQAKIIPIAQSSGANIRRVQVLKQKEEEHGFQKVGLRVVVLGKLKAIQATVHALEAYQPLLFIENIEVVNRQGGNPSNKVGRKRSDPDLQVQFDLFGYLAPMNDQEKEAS
ncbi:type II secretion system protein GspM [Kiloniella majae]|uniref:type II secretion system protein GspM n=1 Tax=Kiloniella majae TaxID=1938558 RepID=UPI000A277F90|nr:type II secretion system protein GspM [Kiloniella majae]